MIYTKAIARFHRLLDRFHRRSVDSILEASVTLDVALSDRFGLSRGESDVMLQRYSRLEGEIADALMRPATADATLTSLLFLLIVMRKPQRVIETGVWHGVSSYVLLSAMKDVGTGRPISIDLPPPEPRRTSGSRECRAATLARALVLASRRFRPASSNRDLGAVRCRPLHP